MFDFIHDSDKESKFWNDWKNREITSPAVLLLGLATKQINQTQYILLNYFYSFNFHTRNPHKDSKTQIGRRLGMTRKTVAVNLEFLEKEGFIKIIPDGDFIIIKLLIATSRTTYKTTHDQSLLCIECDENDEIPEQGGVSNGYSGGEYSLPTIVIHTQKNLALSKLENENKENIYKSKPFVNAVNIKEDFDINKGIKTLYPQDLNRIRQHWIDIGLQYKSTAWELNDLRKIGEIIATHGADIESILNAITAYSSVINNPDSFYTFKHSITSFFGSKGAWEKFLEGNYFEGQFNKSGLGTYDIEKRKQEIFDGLNQLNGLY